MIKTIVNSLKRLGRPTDAGTANCPPPLPRDPSPTAAKPPLRIADLDRAAAAFTASGTDPNGPWGEFQGRILELPEGFDLTLDPMSPAYRHQQIKLWRAISGREADYDPYVHEATSGVAHVDPVRRPGFYAGRHLGASAFAGDQLIALGHVLKRANLAPGDRVLEYGAGFGQIALSFARLGMRVDTVDIDWQFCAAVRAQAEVFGVELTAFEGQFGLNPRPECRYNLILFYEAFHHSLDFLELIARIKGHLAPGGRVILSGEPIAPADSAFIPYPWGIRLDAECVAVVRHRGWFELGFHEDFLVAAFIRNGFLWRHFPTTLSHWANLHEFRERAGTIMMEDYQLPKSADATWHSPKPGGRFSLALSILPVDCLGTYETLRLNLLNPHRRALDVDIRVGDHAVTLSVDSQGWAAAEIPRSAVTGDVQIRSPTIRASAAGATDPCELGIFLTSIEYLS